MRALVGLLVVLFTIAGCNRGPTPPKRGPLSGKITLDGKPVANGQIRLMSLEPNGINAVAAVTSGEYHMPADLGPAKGKYRVEFSVPSATKRRIPNDDIPGQWLEEAPETLPARYHRESAITFDYDPATKPTFDYDLRSQ